MLTSRMGAVDLSVDLNVIRVLAKRGTKRPIEQQTAHCGSKCF